MYKFEKYIKVVIWQKVSMSEQYAIMFGKTYEDILNFLEKEYKEKVEYFTTQDAYIDTGNQDIKRYII